MAKNNKNINYLGRDFYDFRNNLVEYTKTYFPTTYNDFNESSPGMMFIELASYIGDVLSYYTDASLKETFVQTATESSNLFRLANMLGYKPKISTPAITTLSVFQLSKSNNGVLDNRYLLRIKSGLVVGDENGNARFTTLDDVDFADSTDREITVYSVDSITKKPDYFLIKKKIKAISAELKTQTFSVGSPQSFFSLDIDDSQIISVDSVYDTNGNRWYEVPYLAQEMVYVDYPNISEYDPDLSQFKDSVPYILKLIKTNKRFTVKINENRTISLEFGSGNLNASDELIIPNVKNVGLGLNNSISRLEESYDPTNFLKTKTYGEAPANTTLTVKYLVGGGISSNIESGKLKNILNIEFDDSFAQISQNLDSTIYSYIKSSIAVENEIPATGGKGIETNEEIRQNILSNFAAQNRAVTAKDYQIRALSMPPKYGSIAKVYAISDNALNANSPEQILKGANNSDWFARYIQTLTKTYPNISNLPLENVKQIIKSAADLNTKSTEQINPFAINLYVLGFDSNSNYTQLNRAVKENLKTYLNEYRILTDGVNIIDGFIINIGVNFDIKVSNNFNRNEVLLRCINEIKSYFNVDKWQFNQAIYISEIEVLLASVDGVASVSKVNIVNKCGGDYSKNRYNISNATKDKIVYPSLDPSIFEIKFPNQDIIGRVI